MRKLKYILAIIWTRLTCLNLWSTLPEIKQNETKHKPIPHTYATVYSLHMTYMYQYMRNHLRLTPLQTRQCRKNTYKTKKKKGIQSANMTKSHNTDERLKWTYETKNSLAHSLLYSELASYSWLLLCTHLYNLVYDSVIVLVSHVSACM